MGWGSCQHPQKENLEGWGLGAVITGTSALLSSSCPSGGSSEHSVLSPGCPHHPSVAFVLLPIHIYLFIDFYEISLPSNSYCPCCPDHPPHPSHPAVCAAVCLSVTRKIKMASSRTYVWSMGRDGWGYRVLGVVGQGHFTLLLANES